MRATEILTSCWTAVLLVAAPVALGGCEWLPEDEDCRTAEEIWGEKTQTLGQKCYRGSYGGCERDYDDCIEGECRYSSSANSDICTMTCGSDADCLGDFCRDGICQPRASCETYCDGTCCCSYHNDPADPTRCVQGSCSCG
jgi:hypothetical protein